MSHSREIMTSSERQDWATPPALFEQLNREFHFTLDVAAVAESAKCRRWYGPGSPIRVDALSPEPWGGGQVAFINPPYGVGLDKWIARCHEEAQRGTTVVALIYARTETAFFHDHVMHADEVRLLRGRVTFLDPDTMEPRRSKKTGAVQSSTAPSVVVIWRARGHGPPRFVGMEQEK